jgi:hypothetical protein
MHRHQPTLGRADNLGGKGHRKPILGDEAPRTSRHL